MLLEGGSRITCVIEDMFPGLDLYYTDPARHLIPEVWDLDDLSVDDLSMRRVIFASSASALGTVNRAFDGSWAAGQNPLLILFCSCC